jgi:dihydrofolate reductase
VRIGGGVATIRQYLDAQLIDELHLAIAPILLGAGENLFEGFNLPALGYEVVRRVASDAAMHVIIERR